MPVTVTDQWLHIRLHTKADKDATMKIVALVSGGKDSCYAMMESVRYGHEIVCLAHLHPPVHLAPEDQEIDSFMYQSVGHNVVQLIAESMGKPLVTGVIAGKALSTDIDYVATTNGDEVEDLHRLLEDVMTQYPDVQGVCTGAILSSYQRNRVENVCTRLGLVSLGYLWRRDQEELLGDMVDAGVDAIIVKVAAIGLSPHKHLGRTIADLQMDLLSLQEQYELNVCGEGGEYETLTLDCPLFTKRIVIDASRTVLHSDDYFAPVAFLVIEQCHLEDKDNGDVDIDALRPCTPAYAPYVASPKPSSPSASSSISTSCTTTALAVTPCPTNLSLPAIASFRNQFFLSGVMTSLGADAPSLEDEIADVFDHITTTLARYEMTLEDVCFVHLYVRDMDDFARINTEYCKYFGQYMPPSRSCVELRSLPTRVLLDGLAIRGSGVAKRETPRSAMRDVLHIKSLSAWAPNCIGPYSQGNILHKALLLLAGQVAFQPQTMEIIGETHLEQTHQALRNAANVLDALASNLRHVSCAVVYVTAPQHERKITGVVEAEARRLLISNAGVRDAFENAYNSCESDDDVDKDAALKALATHAPLLVVELSRLPRDALVEAELQALTHAPVKTLRPLSRTMESIETNGWRVEGQYSAITRSLCHVVCTAQPMAPHQSLATACSGLLLAVQNAFEAAEMPWDRLCHLRVFYVPQAATPSEWTIAQAIHDALSVGIHGERLTAPALTFVPVEAIQNDAQIAIQITAQDLDKLETDLWLRKQI